MTVQSTDNQLPGFMNHDTVQTYNPERVRQLYRRVVPIYDLWSRLTEERALRTILKWADIQDGQDILEAGVGTGRLFSRVVSQNKTGRNVGIDLSAAMLKRTKKRCAGHNNIQLLEADLTELPDNLGNFDIIFSTYVLDLLPENLYVAILSRLGSMLKPDGKLLLAYMEAGKSPSHRFWAWVSLTFPALMTNCRPVHLEPYLRQAGFTITRSNSFTQLSFPSCVIETKRDQQK